MLSDDIRAALLADGDRKAKIRTNAKGEEVVSFRCPKHDDDRPSAYMKGGSWYCKRCGIAESITGLAGLIGVEPKGANGRGDRAHGLGNIIDEYDYVDEHGEPLYQVVRLEPKDFRIRCRDGNGGWRWGLGGVQPVLYRLSEVVAAIAAERTVYIVEGEKDADRLAAAGLTATTNAMGAGKWKPEYVENLHGAIVCVVPDNDDPGLEHARSVARSVMDVAAEVRILELPDLGPRLSSHGKDVSDWLDAGHTVDGLAELAFDAPLYEWESALGEWDAGTDEATPSPRGWLLGNIFCRRFVSSLLADGGVGKTALRYAQLLSLAIGRSLTGEHVFQRCRVLIVSLEDDTDELRRRILAVMLRYDVSREAVRGWLFLAAPDRTAGKLMIERDGEIVRSGLADTIEAVVTRRNIDIVSLDPFVKSHGVDENSNHAIDAVIQLLADLASKHDIAVDVPHHTSKGLAEPGNANRGRGASAMKDGARLVYTLTPMSSDEAQTLGISDGDRRFLIRMDGGKVNITPPLTHAKWFRLVGVPLGNRSELYPNGDEVQTVESWQPPETWGNLSTSLLNQILDAIDAGLETTIATVTGQT